MVSLDTQDNTCIISGTLSAALDARDKLCGLFNTQVGEHDIKLDT